MFQTRRRAASASAAVVVDDAVDDPSDEDPLEHPATSAPTTTRPSTHTKARRRRLTVRKGQSLAHPVRTGSDRATTRRTPVVDTGAKRALNRS